MRIKMLSAALLVAVPSFGIGRAADTHPQPDAATEVTRMEITLAGRWQCTYGRVTPAGVELNWVGDGPTLEVKGEWLGASGLPELEQWRRFRLDATIDPPRIQIEEGERRPPLEGTVTEDGDELLFVLNGKMKRPFLPREKLDERDRARLREKTKEVEIQRVLRARRIDVHAAPTDDAKAAPKRQGFVFDIF